MQRFFQPISVSDAFDQQQRVLQQSAAQAAIDADQRRQRELMRPGPGRPRKALDADAVLTAAAAAAPSTADEGAAANCEEPPSKRGKYTSWLSSPFVHDILAAYQLNLHNAKATVRYLQRTVSRLPTDRASRFDELAESTVRSWHDTDGQLLPRFRQVVDEQREARRGPGKSRALYGHPEVEDEVKRILHAMREKGAVVNLLVIRMVMRAVIEKVRPELLAELRLSKGFLSEWAREELGWTWRVRTTTASKLPLDWRQQGIEAAKRVAFNMQVHKVHPSLIINMDQTGVHLAPVDSRTYEAFGSKEVKVIGTDDKRQITACVASSLDGDLLPLQLIFQGKTPACHPPLTDSARAAFVHLTHSPNHWSNQETMQEWISEVLIPYADRRVAQHNLPFDSHIVLVLDVWAVHKSEEFRRFLRTHHPRIHLVFVPPNCTSQLQVADVILQRPFKHGLRCAFNAWAASIIKEQVEKEELVGLTPYLKMSLIKPLILEWCIESWNKMQGNGFGREYIKFGWHTCCVSLFNVLDPVKRQQVVEEVALNKIDGSLVPEGEEAGDAGSDSEHESDDEKDVLDVMKQRQFGERKSDRKRKQPKLSGYFINSQQVAMTDDSD